MIGDSDFEVQFSEFEGWTFEKAVVSPPPEPMNVIRLRAPNGRVSWVALCGAFGLGAERMSLTTYELKPGHRILKRIELAEQRQAVSDRLVMHEARRKASSS